VSSRNFQVICEIEPPTRPDLMHVRHQIGTLSKVADAFLIPDNHLGRATVSSVAVAHEVQAMGGRSIACLNSRDRNLLGFRRDLLTAASYGVDQFLFVYGDKPSSGSRTGELTVRAMIDEVRALPADPAFRGVEPFRAGAATALRPLPAWKRAADFLFVQVSFSVEALLRWREEVQVDVPVFAGVMVLASEGQAQRLAAAVPDIEIPGELVERVRTDRSAGVEATCDLVLQLRDSGGFDGVHLIPVARYREVAARLEQRLA
jgi:methylenetetrahydrofolate reductase (NADPH)